VSFDQDDLPRQEFEQNPLKTVVAQLRYPPEIALDRADNLAALQACFRARYPIAMEREQQIGLRVESGPGGVPQIAPPVPVQGPQRFADEDNAWVVAVATDSLSLETTTYRNGEEFRARWADLIASFMTVVTPARVDRFGVRYINQLWHPEARSAEDWTRFLNRQLMGSIASDVLAPRVAQATEQVLMVVGSDGASVRRTYALNPEGAEAPSTVVLDLDLFSATAFPFDAGEILGRFDRYHKWAWNLFRRSITDEMANALGEVRR
jgi:uncharacterized protein (TIGR04255 family)